MTIPRTFASLYNGKGEIAGVNTVDSFKGWSTSDWKGHETGLEDHYFHYSSQTPTSAVDVVILLAIARTSRVKPNVCCVHESRVTATCSYRNHHDMKNSTAELSEVGLQLPERRVTLHLNV